MGAWLKGLVRAAGGGLRKGWQASLDGLGWLGRRAWAGARWLAKRIHSAWVKWLWRPLGKALAPVVEPLRGPTRRLLAITGLQALMGALNRIAPRLYFSIGGALAFTMAASLVAWVSITRIADIQSSAGDRLPDMVTAFLVAQQGDALAAAGARLTGAVTLSGFERVRGDIAQEIPRFQNQLNEFYELEGEQLDKEQIRVAAANLVDNIRSIEESVAEAFTLEERIEAQQAEALALRARMEGLLGGALDAQLAQPPASAAAQGQPQRAQAQGTQGTQPPADVNAQRFRSLMELELAINQSIQLLVSVFDTYDLQQLDSLRERFDASTERVRASLESAGANARLPLELQTAFNKLLRLGAGESGSFGLQEQALLREEEQLDLLTSNRGQAIALGNMIKRQVQAEQGRTFDTAGAARDAIADAQNYLLWINLLAVAGAIAIGWGFIGQLVGRINMLSDKMRSMADGNLKRPVKLGGHDEVAEMAAALEVFRRSSLEAQRLNLVEKLADELTEKNERLEGVLEELRHAQNQIVMQEKLAALGELTAGVAHEIKNPLNFVKNFTEGSVEMLRELSEELQKAESGKLSGAQQKAIKEISDDLEENLGSILRNSERANRIVQDMLSMGRGSEEFQMAEINSVITEHVRLAYHSARATDNQFQLDIKEDLDPKAGQLNIIPHDLGRVFLNMVNNACYATDEKRKELEAKGKSYKPELSVSTRREGKQLVITLKDNGPGIPKKILADVFNPFFTTKPPDKGTGLGLALSNDIVMNHGGRITARSQEGKWTEMRIALPTDFTAPQQGEDG